MTAKLLQRGFAMLNRAAGDVAAESVRYLRGVQTVSDDMSALLGRHDIALADTGEASVYSREFRWQLKRSDLVLAGVPITPTRGDRIVWEHDDTIYTFEVLPQTGTPETDANDPRSDWLPVSAKLVQT